MMLRLPLCCLLLSAAGCGDQEQSSVEIHVANNCGEGCIDRHDLFVLRGSCVYAWRVDQGGKQQSMSQLELDRGSQVTVEVLGRCGADSCPRCSAKQSFAAGSKARVDLTLKKVASCVVGGRVTTPCATCLPGPDAYCDGDFKVTCPSGQAVRQSCPNGCDGGVCLGGCTQKKIYYQDKDGDSYGNSAAQKEACSRPAGYAEARDDCDDEDNTVHPGQTAFFTVGTKNKPLSFDYNCDNKNEPEYPSPGNCSLDSATNKCVGEGWLGLVPGCGGLGAFYSCIKDIGGACKWGVPLPKIQACR